MNLRSLSPVLLVAFLVGCQAEEPKAVGTPAKGNPVATGNPSTTPTPSGNEAAPPVAGNADEVPAELKTAAYEYYGLGNEMPMDMEVKTTADAGVRTGSQITRFKGMEGGKAVYQIERTGGLTELLGQMEVSLENDGIYVKSASMAKVGEHDIEMPAKLDPGATWEARTVVEQPDRQMNVLVKFTVVGEQSVTTPKGARSALLVTSTGTGTMMTKNVRMDSKSWYVKGVGMVKSELKFTDTSGKASTITIQEAK
ncbi:hypothetical protein EON81_22175 [bacterium]|nr:MAG: hypothetical protein EON81_22175 [bacterium]